MRYLKLIHIINNELKSITKQLHTSNNVMELLQRRSDLLHRKEICENHLYKF